MKVNKRKRSDEEEDKQAISRRNKLQTTVTTLSQLESSSLISKRETAPQFQRFHLNILQSLYESDDEDNNDGEGDQIFRSYEERANNNTTNNYSAVDNKKLWTQTKKFLREREKLIRQKQETLHLKNVHQEAMNFMGERAKDAPTQSPAPLTASSAAWPSVSKSKGGSSAFAAVNASPAHSLSFFSPHSVPSQQPSNANNSYGKSPVNCFGLVANLLEKKFQSFEKSARYNSDPYGTVLKEIVANISNVENQLERLQEETVANQKQAVEDLLSRPMLLSSLASTARSSPPHSTGRGPNDVKHNLTKLETKLETKLGLWKMLEVDMKEVVVVA